MDSKDNNKEEANIPPMQLDENSRFKFKCHKDVPCFTQCCRGINIMLTPYDIVRMKNRMQISSEEFLAIYTKPELLEKTDLPVVTLKLLDDEQESCPFVKEEGCMVYEDRPTTCRYYPLGVASLSYKEQEKDGFYIMINEPHCKGFEEDREWTVKEWRKDQGVDIHDEINAEWTELLVRKRSIPKNVRLTEKTKNMFFTASYDIDRFKRFVFESTFLTLYDIDPKTVEEIKKDELSLLRFSFKWLKWLLFKEGEFKLNETAAQQRQEDSEEK
jgi:uncharacterized protein